MIFQQKKRNTLSLYSTSHKEEKKKTKIFAPHCYTASTMFVECICYCFVRLYAHCTDVFFPEPRKSKQ